MIEIRGVSKSYRRTRVLTDVNVDLRMGEITFLMGRNGAGKTTLIKTMLGLEKHSGRIPFDGRPLAQVYGSVGVVFDDAPVYRRLTGYQNVVLLSAHNAGREAVRSHSTAFLSDGELRRRAGGYSYGQRKKLALAIALLGTPEYLVMDEASNGLDYETTEWLKVELRRRSAHATILLTGHQFDFYDDIVDRVLILKDGHVEETSLAGRSPRGLGVLYEAALTDGRR